MYSRITIKWRNYTKNSIFESDKYKYIRRMPTVRVSGQLTINCIRRSILSHAETKKCTQNQPNKGTQGYNHRGQQHKRHNTKCAKFLWGHDPTKLNNQKITLFSAVVQGSQCSAKESRANTSSRHGLSVEQGRLFRKDVTNFPFTRTLEGSVSRKGVSHQRKFITPDDVPATSHHLSSKIRYSKV